MYCGGFGGSPDRRATPAATTDWFRFLRTGRCHHCAFRQCFRNCSDEVHRGISARRRSGAHRNALRAAFSQNSLHQFDVPTEAAYGRFNLPSMLPIETITHRVFASSLREAPSAAIWLPGGGSGSKASKGLQATGARPPSMRLVRHDPGFCAYIPWIEVASPVVGRLELASVLGHLSSRCAMRFMHRF